MDFYILDNTFGSEFSYIDIVNNAVSKIWRREYSGAGDFEIYAHDTAENRKLLKLGRYVARRDDDMFGIIEKINHTIDRDGKHMMLASGRSGKALFARRIIYPQSYFVGSVWNRMYWMLYNHAVNPKDPNRKIPATAIRPAEETPDIGASGETQHTGTNLMDAVIDLVESNNMGWEVAIEYDAKGRGTATARLIRGIDRTADQTATTPVIFSEDFNNIISLEYEKDMTGYANVASIAGEGEGSKRTWTGVDATGKPSGKFVGMNRYEMFVDANDLRKSATDNHGNEIVLTDAQYRQQLQARGLEKLQERQNNETMQGEVTARVYKYKIDYNVGDLVTVETSAGVKANTRIVAVEEIEDDEGYTVTPEFSEYILSDFNEG